MRILLLTISLAVTLSTGEPSAQPVQAPRPAQPRGPKLVVMIAVDQMRGDYIDKFQHQWTAGLKRLVTEGAWFRQADYPYYNTVTCARTARRSGVRRRRSPRGNFRTS